jgi:NAD(P)-dependent dehydrogenase (short-subunit alcohol dehydrogenase family)
MKTYIVTGAMKPGIGAAITKSLLEAGHSVLGTVEPDTEVAQINCDTSRLHLTTLAHADPVAVDTFCRNLPSQGIDGYVNAQMFFHMEAQLAFDHEAWEKSIYVNLSMPNRIFRNVLDRFTAEASVVAITSTEAFMGSFGATAYASSKAAIHNLVKSWANVSLTQSQRAGSVVLWTLTRYSICRVKSLRLADLDRLRKWLTWFRFSLVIFLHSSTDQLLLLMEATLA